MFFSIFFKFIFFLLVCFAADYLYKKIKQDLLKPPKKQNNHVSLEHIIEEDSCPEFILSKEEIINLEKILTQQLQSDDSMYFSVPEPVPAQVFVPEPVSVSV